MSCRSHCCCFWAHGALSGSCAEGTRSRLTPSCPGRILLPFHYFQRLPLKSSNSRASRPSLARGLKSTSAASAHLPRKSTLGLTELIFRYHQFTPSSNTRSAFRLQHEAQPMEVVLLRLPQVTEACLTTFFQLDNSIPASPSGGAPQSFRVSQGLGSRRGGSPSWAKAYKPWAAVGEQVVQPVSLTDGPELVLHRHLHPPSIQAAGLAGELAAALKDGPAPGRGGSAGLETLQGALGKGTVLHLRANATSSTGYRSPPSAWLPGRSLWRRLATTARWPPDWATLSRPLSGHTSSAKSSLPII